MFAKPRKNEVPEELKKSGKPRSYTKRGNTNGTATKSANPWLVTAFWQLLLLCFCLDVRLCAEIAPVTQNVEMIFCLWGRLDDFFFWGTDFQSLGQYQFVVARFIFENSLNHSKIYTVLSMTPSGKFDQALFKGLTIFLIFISRLFKVHAAETLFQVLNRGRPLFNQYSSWSSSC